MGMGYDKLLLLNKRTPATTRKPKIT